MDRLYVGIAGIGVALVLIALRMQVGAVLGLVAFIGIAVITSMNAAWGILTAIPKNFIAQWSLSAVPMFLLMGYIAAQAGLTKGLFAGARILLGKVPGGLASATVFASALFASASGSSVATAAAFSQIAVPEMQKSKYKLSLATGCVAASGTLGSLIPPSLMLILFGIFTNTSISGLFVGGVLPGVLSAVIYIGMITIRASRNPELAPLTHENHTRKEIIDVILDIWPLPTLIVAVLGGMFVGIFTPTEAGAVGAAVAVMIALFRRTLSRKAFLEGVIQTAVGTSAVFIIAIGAQMFTVFMGLSTLPIKLANTMLSLVSTPIPVILSLSVVFVILGMFMESVSLMLLTIPVVHPILNGLGIDMIWFGIIMVKLLEIGMITPPFGINIYVIRSSLGSQVKLAEVFYGAFWFLAMDILTLLILIAFPAITLFLPGLMD
jgi:tripartite ATP-independent transporter DctM subunit